MSPVRDGFLSALPGCVAPVHLAASEDREERAERRGDLKRKREGWREIAEHPSAPSAALNTVEAENKASYYLLTISLQRSHWRNSSSCAFI